MSGTERGQPTLSDAQQAALRYRRAQVLGLLIVAALILAAALWRSDPHTLFPPGWWRF